MKKLKKRIIEITALTVITLFMSTSVFAQIQETQQDTTAQDTTFQSDQQQAQPQEQNQRATQGFGSQEPDEGVDYSESVDKSELPQEINSSLDELYPAHEISEVFKGDDDSYKVKVKNEDDEAVVYYNAEGNFLRAQNLSGLQQEGTLPQDQSQRTRESGDQGQWQTDDQDMNQQGTQQGTQQGQDSWGTETERDADTQQEGTWNTQDDDMNREGAAQSQEQYQRTDEGFRSQNPDEDVEYSETIEEGDLPREVTSSLDELYPAHDIEEVHRGDDDSYKVKVKNEDDVAVVYYNSEGDFLRARNLSDMQGAASQEQSQRTYDPQSQDQWGTDDRTQQGTPMGTGTDTRTDQQGTRQNDWETGTDNTGTRQDESELGTENRSGTWGTDDNTQQENQMGTGTDTRTNQQGTQQNEWGAETGDRTIQQDRSDVGTENRGGNWGTDEQGAHEGAWESDDTRGTNQGTVEAWGDTTQTEGSAYPQEQNQRTQEQDTWGTQSEGSTGSDWESTESDRSGTEGTASPQGQFQRGTSDVDYSEEIEENELPESVTTSLDEIYPDHDIEQAYRGDDGSYKVKVKNQDDEVAVYYDSEGLFYREEKVNDDNKDTNQDW